jgi:hypothetical protein
MWKVARQVVVLLLMCLLGALVCQTVLCLLLFEGLEMARLLVQSGLRAMFCSCVDWSGCDFGLSSGNRDALPQRLAGVRRK